MTIKLTADPRYSKADVPPAVIRSTLELAKLRGHSAERLCRGLGLSPDDLQNADMRVSYRQTSLLIRRVQQAVGDPALGLSAGSRQTIISLGLPGLGMLTCRTLGEAIAYATEHQQDAGALLHHRHFVEGQAFIVEATPRLYDPELEPYFVEEAFSCDVAVVRSLIGPQYNPLRLELSYPKPAYAAAYSAFFKCPLRFGASANRLVSDARWLEYSLPGYEEFTCPYLRAQLESLMPRRQERNDLLESISTHLRAHLDEPRALEETASDLNISVRTLRRRLADLNLSYRSLVDQARHERALDLLKRTSLTHGQIALATGFSDARNFRRAFKRWTGQLPGDARGAPNSVV
ncbi:AraC family transcriptional regulator [Variovorax sp. AFSI2.2]|uniref:AraC family transcriptional regulator n=1 Tax=Variovorax sp. AFSI2.2 TaxID=3384160 RepID=UPI003EB8116A